jgi:hypothetical protein
MVAASAWSGKRTSRPPVVQMPGKGVAHLGRELLDRAVRLEHLLRAVAALADRLQVLEAELHRDGLDVRDGVDPVLHVHDVRVFEAPRDLDDGVHLADVRQELIAEALALVGAANEARDVDEVDDGGDDAIGVNDGVEGREPWIRDGDDADVWLDGAERIVRRLGLGGAADERERVEERRFADVREADDADGKAHVKF